MYKKKKKVVEEDEYGPEEDYEDDDDDEEEVEAEEDEELPSETPRRRKAKKNTGRYELRYQEETMVIVDNEATGDNKIVVSRTHRQFKDDELAQMVIETKKLNDIEEIKRVVGV